MPVIIQSAMMIRIKLITTLIVVDLPTPTAPPSSWAMLFSRASMVGFPRRVYLYPGSPPKKAVSSQPALKTTLRVGTVEGVTITGQQPPIGRETPYLQVRMWCILVMTRPNPVP